MLLVCVDMMMINLSELTGRRPSGISWAGSPNAGVSAWRDKVRGRGLSCLFLINGLGMGNSTRCYAVVQQLAAAGVKIHVLTSGNGLRFFEGKPEITSLRPVESFFYAVQHNRLSAWRTVLSLGAQGRRAVQKRAQVEAAVKDIRPDFCVTDSEYTLGPMRKRGIPLIALNNSDVVIREYMRMRNKPRELRGQFWAIEYMDYLFHRHFADLVISPAAKAVPAVHPKIRRVGLIVRREIEDLAARAGKLPQKPAREFRKLTFMLSGSVLGRSGNICAEDLPYHISVVGIEGRSSAGVTFHGKILDNIPLLAQADMLLINAGFSAVSEALALRKPTLVIPVARHAEQYVNARQVVELGFGAMVAEQEVASYLRRAYETNAFVGRAKGQQPLDISGAAQAAKIIFGFLRSRGMLASVTADSPAGNGS